MKELLKVAQESFYLNPDMIRFLIIENLALKTLLANKNVFSPEEFQEAKSQAELVMQEKEQVQIKQYFKVALSSSQEKMVAEAHGTHSPVPG